MISNCGWYHLCKALDIESMSRDDMSPAGNGECRRAWGSYRMNVLITGSCAVTSNLGLPQWCCACTSLKMTQWTWFFENIFKLGLVEFSESNPKGYKIFFRNNTINRDWPWLDSNHIDRYYHLNYSSPTIVIPTNSGLVLPACPGSLPAHTGFCCSDSSLNRISPLWIWGLWRRCLIPYHQWTYTGPKNQKFFYAFGGTLGSKLIPK